MARAQASGHAIATVRFIVNGLSVQPPKHQPAPGQVNERLFPAYGLSTKVGQRSSVRFVDGSMLHMNQRTELVLRSASLTVVKRGEVAAVVTHGATHKIQTSTAITASVGTLYDVRISRPPGPYAPPPKFPPGTTTVSVVQGKVVVSNQYGSQTVLTNQWTHVAPGKAPTVPTTHNARADVAWTKGLPAK